MGSMKSGLLFLALTAFIISAQAQIEPAKQNASTLTTLAQAQKAEGSGKTAVPTPPASQVSGTVVTGTLGSTTPASGVAVTGTSGSTSPAAGVVITGTHGSSTSPAGVVVTGTSGSAN